MDVYGDDVYYMSFNWDLDADSCISSSILSSLPALSPIFSNILTVGRRILLEIG